MESCRKYKRKLTVETVRECGEGTGETLKKYNNKSKCEGATKSFLYYFLYLYIRTDDRQTLHRGEAKKVSGEIYLCENRGWSTCSVKYITCILFHK